MSARLLKHALRSHPASPGPPGLRVEVQRLVPDDPLRPLKLRFELLGDLVAVRLPAPLPPGVPARTDGLWRHTCFEAFVAGSAASSVAAGPAGPAGPAGSGEPAGGEPSVRMDPAPYVEFNLAPSGAWAVYRFEGYRAGMRPETLGVEPRVVARLAAGQLQLDVALAWPAPLPGAEACASVAGGTEAAGTAARWQGRLGLTAVVEAADGKLSYWALHHPATRPDFHNGEGFTLGIEVPQ